MKPLDERKVTRGSGGWEDFLAALADWTQVKSGQEEEPDPEDQAMLGQSLGSIQVLTRTYTWKMMTVRRVLVPLFQGLGRALVPDNKKDY